MNFQLIGQLVRLRYKLLWAKTRTRNGKIALFMAGYLLLVAVISILAAGGFGAGVVAVKSGKAEQVAQGVLTGLFLWAIVTSIMLGFGMNSVFSDTELRRYPLNARERRFARHFTGALDPFWFLFVALCLGLPVGLYLYGVGSLLLGLFAVLLLYVCAYLTAQVAGLLLERLMQRRGGSLLLPLMIMLLCFVPGILAPTLARHAAAFKGIVRVIAYSPTFGAGSLMTRTDSAAFYGFVLVAWWLVGLTAALVALERRPPKARAVQTGRIRWDTPFDRIGEKFGPKYGPLVAHWLLFYSRCKRLRISYLISLPLIPFLLLIWTKQGRPTHAGSAMSGYFDPFAAAVGVFAVCGLAPAAAGIVNVYGYVGGGFRRYFLFPGDPAASLRAGSYALLTMCAPGILLATLAWMAFPPVPLSVPSIAMLVFSGVAGIFVFHGAGLWTSLYGARRGNPNTTMGNDLSAAGNVLLIGGMMLALMGPRFAGMKWKGLIQPDHWWACAILAVLAGAFYFASLRGAAAALLGRREKLLALLEGKA